MSSLWLPQKEAEKFRDTREVLTAEGAALVDTEMAAQLDRSTRLNRLLREVDPNCTLAFIRKPRDWTDAPPLGIRWDRWHIVRENSGTVPSFIAIYGPNGEYEEPTSKIFDRLRESDMWNSDAMRARKAREAKEQAEKERLKDREAEARKEEFAERWNAASRTQVLLSPDVRWSQNAAGRRGRRS